MTCPPAEANALLNGHRGRQCALFSIPGKQHPLVNELSRPHSSNETRRLCVFQDLHLTPTPVQSNADAPTKAGRRGASSDKRLGLGVEQTPSSQRGCWLLIWLSFMVSSENNLGLFVFTIEITALTDFPGRAAASKKPCSSWHPVASALRFVKITETQNTVPHERSRICLGHGQPNQL